MVCKHLRGVTAAQLGWMKQRIRSYLKFRADVARFQKEHFSDICSQRCFTSQTSACCGREGIITFFADVVINALLSTGEEIDKFTGILKPFHNMNELIEKHLNVSFLYPLTIVDNPKIKLSAAEKEMVNKARIFMKESNFDHFYSLYLMPANTCTPKDYNTIFSLIDKGIFHPNKPEEP